MDSHKPVLIVIAGPNGSGKTSITKEILHHKWMENAAYINPDEVAQHTFGDWNDKDAVMQAVKYCEEWREQCLKEQKSLIFETVLSIPDKVDYIFRAKKAGFFIRLFFVCTIYPTINAARIAQRVLQGGHDVPISKVINRYYKSIALCNVASYVADRTYVYDNSAENESAKLLFRLTEGSITKTYTENIPEWALPIYERRPV